MSINTPSYLSLVYHQCMLSHIYSIYSLMQGGNECRGADELISLLSNYSRNSGIKTAIRVGIVGESSVRYVPAML